MSPSPEESPGRGTWIAMRLMETGSKEKGDHFAELGGKSIYSCFVAMWIPYIQWDTQANAFEFDSLSPQGMSCHAIMHFGPSPHLDRLKGGE